MGIYINPGNKGFQQVLNGKYVDKSGLIAYINEVGVNYDRDKGHTCIIEDYTSK